uniref:Vesicle-trafficking protein SEC22a-like n=2 Tax=Hirondellea gigas TaxID=1518452 RepID=A0A2P2ICB2_9CRUS
MIHYGTLLRLSDGTPLSATTDSSSHHDLGDAKKAIKQLALKLNKYSNRACLQEDTFTIHCIHNFVVGFVAVCEPTYSHLLAYSFLDELYKEFNILYTASVVAAVRRPYSFIEFDGFLEKVRQKYNSPRSVAARVNLPALRTELSLNPPSMMSLSDLTPSHLPTTPSHTALSLTPNGNIANGHIVDHSQVGVTVQMMPLTVASRVSMVLAVVLSLLDLYRGFFSLSQSDLEEYDGPSPLHGFGFLLESFILISQVEVLRRYHRFRKLWSLGCAVLMLLICLLLLNDVRETWLSLLYVVVSACITLHTLNRNFRKKLSRFNV